MNESYYDIIKRARDMMTGEYDEIQFEKEIEKLKREKQNLIDYLEHKIKQYSDIMFSFETTMNENAKTEGTIRLKIYQEILDKIKEGNYE